MIANRTKLIIDFFFALIFILLSASLQAQNTSNKGTDFWLGYMGHIDGTNSHMSLYLTSDVSTSGIVSIPLQGWSTPFTITANKTTIITIPAATAYVNCSDCIQDKGIHITSDLPIVMYSHIYSSARSDATLVLPVPTLGKEYYAMAFTQTSGGYSEFLVAAVEDSTEVEITPSQATLNGHVANVPFTVTLNQGQVYQVQSKIDLTGSHIITYSSGNLPCKHIGVFSGSSWCALGCANASSGDNLYKQLYPVNTWGNNFVTVPFATRIGGDIFRIFAGRDNTSVTINGRTPFILNTAQFTDILLDSANYITASKQITLAQYPRTQSCDNITGDPSMVILSPVDQILDTITVYAATKAAITGEYINLIMKTTDTSSFRLDGSNVSFSIVQSNPLYSYSQNQVDSGNHTLIADSGFNAIVYGFGNIESYAYSAGANVRNLRQYISASSGSLGNPHTLCIGATVNFSGVVSYSPASVIWNFGNGDTSSSLLATRTYNTPGKYIISLVTATGNSSSCDENDSSNYVLNIVPSPTTDFSFTVSCENDTVYFKDLTTSSNSTIISWKWYFGDGDSSSLQNPIHQYYSIGTFIVKLLAKSSAGCIAEVDKSLALANFNAFAGPDTSVCKGAKVQLQASGGVSYSWQPISSLDDNNISDPVATVSNPTTYTVEITNSSGCSANRMVVIDVSDLLIITVSNDTSVCKGAKVQLQASGGVSYSWQPISFLDNNNSSNPVATVSNTTTYTVEITNSSGCSAGAMVVIDVNDLPTITTSNDTSICKSQPVTLSASGANHLIWFNNGVIVCNDCNNTEVQTLHSAIYNVIGIDNNGCTGAAEIEVSVNSCQNISMPNAFSPNNDGKNDLFRPHGLGVTQVEYFVYNRWGQELFIGRDLINGWDGKYKGMPQPVGVYVWKLSATLDYGNIIEQKGNVMLLR